MDWDWAGTGTGTGAELSNYNIQCEREYSRQVHPLANCKKMTTAVLVRTTAQYIFIHYVNHNNKILINNKLKFNNALLSCVWSGPVMIIFIVMERYGSLQYKGKMAPIFADVFMV